MDLRGEGIFRSHGLRHRPLAHVLDHAGHAIDFAFGDVEAQDRPALFLEELPIGLVPLTVSLGVVVEARAHALFAEGILVVIERLLPELPRLLQLLFFVGLVVNHLDMNPFGRFKLHRDWRRTFDTFLTIPTRSRAMRA